VIPKITSETNMTKTTLTKKTDNNHNREGFNILTPFLINWTLNTINSDFDGFMPPYDIHDSIDRLETLPPMPDITLRIMQLANNPTPNATQLASIIKLDPLLTRQIICWASSSLYACPKKTYSTQELISQVLGYDVAINLALGLSVLTTLKAPLKGPIGTRLFLIQAMASTQLMPMLNNQLAVAQRFHKTEIFQSGFLQNIGIPLLNNKFPLDFKTLNRLVVANPNIPIIKLEKFSLGVGHNMLGAWLMRFWNMPKSIVDVAYNHHNPNYRGDNYQLNLLTYINNCLLAKLGIGRAQTESYSEEHIHQLNLPGKGIEESLDRLNEMLAKIITTVDMIAEY
jgi:HD-like signal output (HDOD) protein